MRNEIVNSTVPNLPVHIGYTDRGRLGLNSTPHYHDEIELLKVTNGRMSCTVNGVTYEITSGEIAFFNSRAPHSTAFLEDGTSSILIQINNDAFLNDDIGKYLSRFMNNEENQFILIRPNNNLTKKLTEYVDNIKNEYIQKELAYEISIKANVYNILTFLYRIKALFDVKSIFDFKSLDKVLPILQFIDENYQEPITLEKISSIVNLNQSYFCRLFKKATNSTLMEYINFVRISKAEKLLSTTENNIVEISLETGFSSVSYFNRTFKRYKNCTPTAYRRIKYAQK